MTWLRTWSNVAPQSRSSRLLVALGVNAALVVAEVVGGAVAHSSALLADGGHNLADVGGLVLAYGALRLALRSPTVTRTFGYHRATILSALANVALLAVVSVLVAVESIVRLVHPVTVDGGVVAVIAAIAVVVNLSAAAIVHESSGELNMKSATLHLASDAVAAFAVLVVGIVLFLLSGPSRLDPAVSLGISVLVAFEAIRLARESVDILLESAPPDVDLGVLEEEMGRVEGVSEVHDVHCWSLSSEVRALSAHLVLTGHPSLEEAHAIGSRVKSAVGASFSIADATLELEAERCVDEEGATCTIERATFR